jgi:putative pyruvate formate lyase activating enzyme
MRTASLELPKPDPAWTVRDHVPAYLSLDIAEVEERARRALSLLGEERCVVCPRLCRVGRLRDERGLCGIGRRAVVASHFPHFGEENCLRGWNGSGTIFFSGCNLRCVFCQNYDISWEVVGERVGLEGLSLMMLELQAIGCHNINFVTPEHVVPQILEALPDAIARGLRLPIVYNTSAYDSLDSLELMDGIVDVYMPDLKYATAEASRRYSRRADYAEVARRTIAEMNRQVGPLRFDERGLARRGLLLRHLVMPGMLDETDAVLGFVADELGPDTYVDLMAQYYPAGLVGKAGRDGGAQFEEVNRHLYSDEYLQAVERGRALGLRRLDARSVGTADRLEPAPAPRSQRTLERLRSDSQVRWVHSP